MAAGLQVLLQLPPGTEAAVVSAATRHGLAVSGLAEFRYDGTEFDGESTDGLVVNFSAISDSTWDRALELLIDALGDGIRTSEPGQDSKVNLG